MGTQTDRLDEVLAFMGRAERLKDTLRSGRTRAGARESVAAHTWGLCLLALLLEDDLEGVEFAQLLRLCIVHDLGEAISGDVPAIHQTPDDDKAARERADLLTLTDALPLDISARLRALWEEYEAGDTPEAGVAKGLDKIETMLQHITGTQEPGFDYLWNLGYGVARTARTELLQALRRKVDLLTRAKASQPPLTSDMRISGAVPELPVRDVAVAQAWYRDRLGFQAAWINEVGRIGAVSRGDCTLFLRETEGEIAPGVFWIFAQDVDRAFATASTLGADIAAPLETKPWGLRQFTVRDLHGHLFHFHHDS